jgi:uncharacterized membrane protein YhaH (DUF805 family)
MYLDGTPVSFREAITAGLHNGFVYRGRASRSAYWWFVLAAALGNLAILALASVVLTPTTQGGAAFIIVVVLSLGMLYPTLASFALTIRRLHDTDRSGWWYLIGIIPYLGVIILLVILARPGTPGLNRYNATPWVIVTPDRRSGR